ncbi:MAG: glycosyltransferase family 4 protein [Alphaproteobacteria bacterium]|nr:glycosyltransferase family 4 protein [Alphaproteobacteria bacterium]MBU0799010.1 glycosyltransferase family 4 protein [Alphaproteobacteria bacterium]MBU0889240.1 glycosyltransferase family 4 protein [Alphaproteobacteria bacterium]MBU1815056.1 glycosyltransferase family 4 protein [Alphaproteobacteria bacterium]
MMREVQALGWSVRHHRLADGFPFPDEAGRQHADAVLGALPDGALTLVDGLALGVLPEAAGRHADRLRLVGLVHHPLAAETGLSEAQRSFLVTSEVDALAATRHIIVTSPFTATALAGYGVTPDRVTTILPGTDAAPPARGSAEGDGGPELALLSVGSLTPRKGHDVLLTALARLVDRDWHLTLAGGARDAETAGQIENIIRHKALSSRVTLQGEVDQATLTHLYDRADLFVLASHYEGYGMVFAEALARGLPILGTTGGAIPTTVPADAGLLVPPGDVEALAAALARLMDEPALRHCLRQGALAARAALPGWPDSARDFAAVLERL